MTRSTWSGRVAALLMAVTSLSGMARAADAPTSQPPHTPGDKLVRGVANVFTSFIEVPRNIHNTTAEDSMLAGWTVGLGKGLGYMALRVVAGVYEIVTFPFPHPRDYEPVVEPEFVWQAPGPRYK